MTREIMLLGIIGTGGCAREVMPFASEIAENLGAVLTFVETVPRVDRIGALPVMSEAEFFAKPARKRFFNPAVSDPVGRAAVCSRFEAKGAEAVDLVSPHALRYERNDIGTGLIACSFSIITTDTRIGRFFHLNTHSSVTHDCVIGDFVTFGPRVSCSGAVHIDSGVFVGAGAVILPGTPERPLRIGTGATIGAGAVVLRDVAPGTTVAGNPARVLANRT
jgi:sugar O-acyltransferase (sialic acid O-acetyltransferase NeuD family)